MLSTPAPLQELDERSKRKFCEALKKVGTAMCYCAAGLAGIAYLIAYTLLAAAAVLIPVFIILKLTERK